VGDEGASSDAEWSPLEAAEAIRVTGGFSGAESKSEPRRASRAVRFLGTALANRGGARQRRDAWYDARENTKRVGLADATRMSDCAAARGGKVDDTRFISRKT